MDRLDFHADPAEFLAVAGPVLEADPVVGTIVATMAQREARERSQGVAPPTDRPYWWLVLLEEGVPIGCAMRSAPFEPYPPLLLPMSEADARLLARALHRRGETVTAVNGFRPATDAFAAETARLAGRRAEVSVHLRLFELVELVLPEPVAGHLRYAREDEVDLAVGWYDAFAAAADEQAGRRPGALPEGRHERDEMLRRIKDERVCFWVDDEDRPLHVTGFSHPAFGVARVGPVYTPRDLRGRGIASNAVAAVSRLLLDRGARVCLYTDQANPVSNRIYQSLGYRSVVDQVSYVLE